jgi:hypothetical protein
MIAQQDEYYRSAELRYCAEITNQDANKLMRRVLADKYDETMLPIHIILERAQRKGKLVCDTVSEYLRCLPFGSTLGQMIQSAAFDVSPATGTQTK